MILKNRAIYLVFIASIILTGCSRDTHLSAGHSGQSIDTTSPVNFNRVEFLSLEPKEQPGTYRHAHEIFPSRRIAKGNQVRVLPDDDTKLDLDYRFAGKSYSIADYMLRNNTTGFLVLKNGRIAYESYFLGADEDSLFTSFSVGKSIVSTLVGLAIGDGLIASVEDKLVTYLPHYKGSGYENVTIKQALQMSSGVDFVEGYQPSKETSFSHLLGNGMLTGTESFSEIMTTMKSKHPPGSVFNYSSGESTVLSELVSRVTGKTASDYLSEKIWSKIGMESDAYWWIDKDGMEFGAGSLSITLRDYGRFGLLMLNEGVVEGKRILPDGWVAEATTPDSEQIQPGKLTRGSPLGYQYQWWTFPGDKNHAYSAQGVFGQFVYINPAESIVIVKTSAWPDAWDPAKEIETYSLFRAIEQKLQN